MLLILNALHITFTLTSVSIQSVIRIPLWAHLAFQTSQVTYFTEPCVPSLHTVHIPTADAAHRGSAG